MYVYELARELGAEPRELLECAALEDMGHISPNTKLSQEQILTLRERYVQTVSPSRGSLFAGGARPAPPPTGAPPSPAVAPAPPPPGDPFDSPLLPPIHDPVEPGGPEQSSGGFGGPLAFDPAGTDFLDTPPPPAQRAPAPSQPAAPPPPAAAPREEPPLWDPLPPITPLAGGGSGAGAPIDYSGSPQPSDGAGSSLTEAEYERQFRADDWKPPKPDSGGLSRSVVIGVVGLIVIVVASMVAGRELGVIGPGAERNCVITTSRPPEGEGVVEEVVCVDGYGELISRNVVTRGGDQAVDFGSNAAGETARVVDMESFCRGAEALLDFRDGFETQLSSASSMVGLGGWYEDNDGFGTAGQTRMADSFGRAGPNERVVDLAAYLEEVRGAARAQTVAQARMLFAASEQTYADHLLEVRNFANGNC